MAQTQQKASFRNRHGLYLSCKPSGMLALSLKKAGKSHRWAVANQHSTADLPLPCVHCMRAGELEGVPEAASGENTEFEVTIVNDKVSIKSHLGKYLTVPRSADRSDHHTRTVE